MIRQVNIMSVRNPVTRPATTAAALALLAAGGLFAQLVSVVKVVSRQVDRNVQLPGEFLPYESVAIFAKVMGFVETVEVDRGSLVRKGQALATLTAPELKANRLEAEAKVLAMESQRAEAAARLAATQSTWERLKSASATPGVVAGNDLIQAEKQVEVAGAQERALESSVAAARSAVIGLRELEAYLRVVAPFDGVITERNVHRGALVGPGAGAVPMLRLEQNSRLRLVVSVPEVDVAGITQGRRVNFTVPAFPGETFTGVIARIPHSMDPKTRSMPVEMDVANSQSRLAPGMYPTVIWPVRKPRPSLLVPSSSIVTTSERSFVIRIRNRVAGWVDVTGGPQVGDLVEVFGLLKEGDLLVVRASDELRDGTRVTMQ
jgi:membrane fusion protein (multidrug efflux system)